LTPTILLFDVDGTLLSTAGAGRRALEDALRAHAVEGPLGFSLGGMTDRAIVRRGLSEAGRDASEALIDTVLATYLGLLAGVVTSTPGYRLHDGVLAALDAADACPRCAVGLGTGNVEDGARIKLERVGIAHRFAFGGFGSDAEDRAELCAIGAERGARRLGVPREQCRVVVIGDTPRDVAAAHAIGAEALAVGTGGASLEELAAARPDHLVRSLAAPAALAALRGGP
jgi:phosphoglycolate phosphatase-like HAD superfamily hydrolase